MSRVCSQTAVSWLGCAVLLVVAAAGCGGSDDKGTGATAGMGGSSSAGKGGTGGAGGAKASAGSAAAAGNGAAYSGDECLAQAKQDAPGFPEACLTCACGQDAATVKSCDGACWALISCAGTKCGDKTGADAQTCAQSMCGAEISASLASGSVAAIQPMTVILQGACSASCAPPSK